MPGGPSFGRRSGADGVGHALLQMAVFGRAGQLLVGGRLVAFGLRVSFTLFQEGVFGGASQLLFSRDGLAAGLGGQGVETETGCDQEG